MNDGEAPQTPPRGAVPKLRINEPNATSQAPRKTETEAGPRGMKWHKFEADNGAVYALDLNSIVRTSNAATAAMCIIDNDICIPLNVRGLVFDCAGHYSIERSPMLIAPPRSVIGQMAILACSRASTR